MPDIRQQPDGFPKEHYDAYAGWEQSVLDHIGAGLARDFPKLYGSIQFNLQGGVYVNFNIHYSGRPKKS